MEVIDLFFEKFILGLEFRILNLQFMSVRLKTLKPNVNILLLSLLLFTIFPSSFFIALFVQLSPAVGMFEFIIQWFEIVFRNGIIEFEISIQYLVKLATVVKHLLFGNLSFLNLIIEDVRV